MISRSWTSRALHRAIGVGAVLSCALFTCAALLARPAHADRPAAAASAKADTLPHPDPARTQAFHDIVYSLAADSMEGRGITTPGIKKAADWIERRMRAEKLEPAFHGSYHQRFPIKIGVTLKPGNRIDGLDSTDWTPLGFSSSGDFSGELVFVGYGIDAPSIGYQEYEGIDLKGKVALMLRYEPQEKDDASPFDGKRPSRWSALRYKVLQARERGAKAVLFVTGPLQDEGNNKIPALHNDGPESPAGIPVAQLRLSAAQRWLSKAGIDLLQFQHDTDRDLVPRSKEIAQVIVNGRIAVEDKYVDSDNMAGIIPGRGRLKDEWVVIGAHYDHLGWGGENSMRPNDHAIHNGADDNASGDAGVLIAADGLRKDLAYKRDHRGVLICLFSGEEVGLAGSAWLVDHPPIPIDKVAAMINLDMVGRLRGNTLIALGLESAPEWAPLLKAAAVDTKLDVAARGDGYGPSDQTSFYAKGIPVIHLFTGTHEQYHTPDDKPATINAEGGGIVARFTQVLAEEASTRDRRLTYARSNAAPTMTGDSRGYGSYLGTVPDFKAMESANGGVLLADVRAGGPAAIAGIKGGDLVVSLAGTRIENLYDMTYALQDHKPGQTVEVSVVRGGDTLTFRATLGDRARMGQAGPAVAKAEAPKIGAEHAVHASGAPSDSSGAPGPQVASATAEAAAPGMPQAAPPMPGNPHQGLAAGPSGPAGADIGAAAVDSFYLNRPGADFVIKAGKPYGPPAPGERHLSDIRQLTFGGENAEAYFSPDGKKLIMQSSPRGAKCDQEYVLDLSTGEMKRVSSGKGRTTCGYYDYPEADRIVYSSTQGGSDSCPPTPDYSQGYVWPIYDTYDIWEANPDGSNAKNLTNSPGYDAEATWCGRGGKFVFTSTRDGDLDLYSMDEAGQVKRLTSTPGYDGGAFYSPDCSQIVFRASRPQGPALEDYKKLLKKGLIRPDSLEIYVMRADGTGERRLTHNGAANFCPTFYPDGKRIIYASNAGAAGPREFDLWLLDSRGGKAEQVTFAPGFDGFPMFSPDGQFLVWASNRADPASHETNIFIARWKD
ncbi:MAG: M28 family peptidase [Bacteroidota bacterium]